MTPFVTSSQHEDRPQRRDSQRNALDTAVNSYDRLPGQICTLFLDRFQLDQRPRLANGFSSDVRVHDAWMHTRRDRVGTPAVRDSREIVR